MMLCCMPSIPLGGTLCINKDAVVFAPAVPLFRFKKIYIDCDKEKQWKRV